MALHPDFVCFGEEGTEARDLASASVAVLPVPYELSPSYGEGSRFAPFHILSASGQMETVDEELQSDWTRPGIHTLPPPGLCQDPLIDFPVIHEAAETVLSAGKPFLALGGDHAITLPLVRAAQKHHPGLAVLQIDAHTDLRQTWNGSIYNHACVMRRITDDLQVPVTAVGIRSFCAEELALMRQRGIKPFFAHEIRPDDDSFIAEVLARLPDKVYLSFDLDGLDPSVLPGTGTPEPGGLSWRQALALIKALGKNKKVVSADVNELAPIPGTHVSEYTAARLCQKIISY
ncbi:MAG: agmatinase, partial [Thermodesulfobacteriota bacterium]